MGGDPSAARVIGTSARFSFFYFILFFQERASTRGKLFLTPRAPCFLGGRSVLKTLKNKKG
jgi:hypothetical protein